MLKRLMDFLLFSTGITPKDHKEEDKYAAIRAKRAEWERLQQARQDAQSNLHAMGSDSPHGSHHEDSDHDIGTSDGSGGDGGGGDGGGSGD